MSGGWIFGDVSCQHFSSAQRAALTLGPPSSLSFFTSRVHTTLIAVLSVGRGWGSSSLPLSLSGVCRLHFSHRVCPGGLVV